MPTAARFQVNAARVVHETVEREVILIHLDRGDYFSLRGVGADMWGELIAGRSLDEIVMGLERSYAGRNGEIQGAAASLVGQLVDNDLLETGPSVSPPEGEMAPAAGEWEPPRRASGRRGHELCPPLSRHRAGGLPCR
jgi:hypothetical protein